MKSSSIRSISGSEVELRQQHFMCRPLGFGGVGIIIRMNGILANPTTV